MEILTSCQSLQEALVIQSILRGSGIEALIPDEYTAQNGLIPLSSRFGIRVLVPADRLEEARKALEETSDS